MCSQCDEIKCCIAQLEEQLSVGLDVSAALRFRLAIEWLQFEKALLCQQTDDVVSPRNLEDPPNDEPPPATDIGHWV